MATRILVIDNYDSFVYTLVSYLQELGAETTVIRHDDLSLEAATALAAQHDGVLLSPGPGDPAGAGVCLEMVRWCGEQEKPMLGVCLGHQALAEAYGATVAHAPELMHGKTSAIIHDSDGVFTGLASPFTATRYHSLAVRTETVPAELEVTASTDTGIIMGLQHKSLPLVGVQFHPESVLTEGGYRLLANWLEAVGLHGAVERSVGMNPLMA